VVLDQPKECRAQHDHPLRASCVGSAKFEMVHNPYQNHLWVLGGLDDVDTASTPCSNKKILGGKPGFSVVPGCAAMRDRSCRGVYSVCTAVRVGQYSTRTSAGCLYRVFLRNRHYVRWWARQAAPGGPGRAEEDVWHGVDTETSGGAAMITTKSFPCSTCDALCCGPVPLSRDRLEKIKAYIQAMPKDEQKRLAAQKRSKVDCKFLDMKHYRCAIYPVRPWLCEAFGRVERMRCSEVSGLIEVIPPFLEEAQFLVEYESEPAGDSSQFNWLES